ncbi:hypothetical protein CDEF62S_00967 [Castellaniella defragrans]
MSTPRSAILAVLAFSALSGCTTLAPKSDAVTQAKPQAADTKLDSVSGAAAPSAVAEPAPAPATAPVSRAAVRLQQLIQQHAVKELSTVYNSNYGASLLFDPQSLQYYAALFYNKDFWKVRSTTDQKRAEQWFEQFSRQSASLAAADFRRIRLQADYDRTEAQLKDRADELSALQSDLEAQREQAKQVSAQQAAARSESARLSKQQADAEKQLRELKASIRKLEAQQKKLR